MFRPLLLFPVVLLMMAAGDDAKKETEKLQGKWHVVSAEKEGMKMPAEKLKEMKFTIEGSNILISETGERVEKAGFALDPSKKPKTIDILPNPMQPDEVVQGIYELDGDNLKFCWRKPGGDRPTAFAPDEKLPTMILILKRAKK